MYGEVSEEFNVNKSLDIERKGVGDVGREVRCFFASGEIILESLLFDDT